MKRSKILTAMLAMTIMLSACGGKDNKDGEKITTATPVTTESETSASTEERVPTEADKVTVGISEEQLALLVNNNFDCATNIFGMKPLPVVGDPVKGDACYQVDPNEYASYDDLYEYVNSVYCKKLTDELFAAEGYDGIKRYFEEDGKLCVNYNAFGAKGYYVDWSGCIISIMENSDTACAFNVTGTIEEPSAEPTKTPYTVQGKAIFEDGKWVLESMIY